MADFLGINIPLEEAPAVLLNFILRTSQNWMEISNLSSLRVNKLHITLLFIARPIKTYDLAI